MTDFGLSSAVSMRAHTDGQLPGSAVVHVRGKHVAIVGMDSDYRKQNRPLLRLRRARICGQSWSRLPVAVYTISCVRAFPAVASESHTSVRVADISMCTSSGLTLRLYTPHGSRRPSPFRLLLFSSLMMCFRIVAEPHRRVHLDDTSDPVTIRIMHGLGSAVSAQSIRAPTRREDYSCGLYIADETVEDLFVLAASRSVTCYPIELLFPR